MSTARRSTTTAAGAAAAQDRSGEAAERGSRRAWLDAALAPGQLDGILAQVLAGGGRGELAGWMRAGGDVNARGTGGETLLWAAAKAGAGARAGDHPSAGKLVAPPSLARADDARPARAALERDEGRRDAVSRAMAIRRGLHAEIQARNAQAEKTPRDLAELEALFKRAQLEREALESIIRARPETRP